MNANARFLLAACGLALLLTAPLSPGEEKKADDEEKKLAAALKKASVNGKYQMLLRQIKVPDDRGTYGDYREYGKYPAADYAGFNDLPAGYWVYVAPHWYIWRGLKNDAPAKRRWGPEQAAGPPDTEMAGDIATAWASQTPDGQDEWLLLEYAEPVKPKEVVVHETFNPGAVVRATAFKLDGEEVEVWKGKDPSAGKAIGVSALPFKGDFKTNRIKLYISSRAVPGYNEIDAVGLKDAAGKTVWAVAVAASSTYAEQQPPVDPRERRIRELEKEVRDLKEKLQKLEKLLDEKDKQP